MMAMNAKLEGGGDKFHRLGAIMAFVCGESKMCFGRMIEQLKMLQSGVTLVKQAISEFAALLEDQEERSRLSALLEQV